MQDIQHVEVTANENLENSKSSSESVDSKVNPPIESANIIQQVKELTATFEKLVLQIKPEISKDQEASDEVSQQNIDSFYDLYRLWQEQVANLTTIQNMQAEDFQKQIMEKDQVRQKLLDDLKNQEHTYLQQIEKLKQQSKNELEAKDKICLELEEQMERQRGEHEFSVSCSICLDPWTLSGYHRLVSLGCGHLFGDPCIRQCLNREQLCPQCRAYATVNEIRYLYGRPI